ncbi:MAG: hypothetical protein QOG64_1755 [Acidimicrobiaceae bacterium]|nr:hypothetical protein [Acidimicrobiaceae bacterium]
MRDDPTAEVTDLLQQMIRNECVNDGTPASGHEARTVDLLQSYLGTSGLDMQTYEPVPGRASLVARIEGQDPTAPTLMLMGHTDVVPSNADGWDRDPYGGELVEGEVWGRGATDMLNLTASMAVAVKRLARRGFRPQGSLVYLAVADEEALGTHGAEFLTAREPDAVATDYVITEGGGVRIDTAGGPRVMAAVAEKGTYWCLLRIRGTPSHASRPFRTDNALVKAAEVVRRISEYRPAAQIGDVWRKYVAGMGFERDVAAALTDPARVYEAAAEMEHIGMARMAHACTHTTFAPTVMHAGQKTNIIPDLVELEVDIRTLPGQSAEDIETMLAEALGDLAGEVEVINQSDDRSSASPMETPLYDAMQRMATRLSPDVTLVPTLMAGATDSRFFRRQGATCYGFSLQSGRIPYDKLATMFHGDNERIDTESLRLTTELWEALAQDFLGTGAGAGARAPLP